MDATKLVSTYIKMRDAKDALTREYDAKVNEIKEQMDVIEQALLEICKTTNQDGGKTPYGSFSRSVKTRYWTNDWDSLYKVVKEYDAFGVLFKAINQTNMKQFLEENPDVMPMGLNVENQYEIVVRRKS